MWSPELIKGILGRIETLEGRTPATRPVSSRSREAELKIIGKQALPLIVDAWYQGETTLDARPFTILFFWEAWCPHCKRELPRAPAFLEGRDDRLQVIALTKQTRNITDSQVRDFINEHGLRFAVAKERGDAQSQHYGVRGIPAAALLHRGAVIWRGHPSRLHDVLDALMEESR